MREARTTDLYVERVGRPAHSEAIPALLIQGVGLAGCAWKPQVDELQGEFELAFFDNRGISKSPGRPGTLKEMGRDALKVMDSLGWDVANLVGHSLGGVIAQQAALLAPQRVRSLSLLCTFADGGVVLSPSLASIWRSIKTVIGTPNMRRRAFFEMVSDPMIDTNEAEMGRIEEVFCRPLQKIPSGTMAQVWELSRSDLRAQLPQLHIPALVLSAAQDKIAPPEQGRILADLLRGRSVQVTGGHACTIQQPGETNDLLRAFWRAPEEFVREGCAAE